MTLIRLACPDCGGALSGSAELTVFACQTCGAVSEIVAGQGHVAGLRRLYPDTIAARHDAATTELALLPVWVVPLASRQLTSDHVAVPALHLGTGGSFLRLARALTMSSPYWRRWADAPRPRCGALLGGADAAALAETVRLACLPRDRRIAVLNGQTPVPAHGAPALRYFPFARRGARLFDMVGGAEVSIRILGDIPWQEIAIVDDTEQNGRPPISTTGLDAGPVPADPLHPPCGDPPATTPLAEPLALDTP